MQLPSLDPSGDSASTHSELEQLPSRHHPLLSLGKP